MLGEYDGCGFLLVAGGYRQFLPPAGKKAHLHQINRAQRIEKLSRAAAEISSLTRAIGSCLINGEVIVMDANGLSIFDLLRCRQHDDAAVLCAFDLIELEGRDLRSAPIEERKDLLGKLLRCVRRSHAGVTLNEHYQGDGTIIYKHACRFGCEGIVSKRLGSRYRSGRVDDWIKIKNPAAPAVKREAEEEWAERRSSRGRRIW
jgi:bifunctional non-homologous end joining protein LigD